MTRRALALAAVLLALASAPAHADRVLSSTHGGREGVGVSNNRLVGWTFLKHGTLIAIITDSQQPVRFRCTAGAPGRRFVMRGVIEDDQLPAFYKTGHSGARVSNMSCTARR